MKKTSFIVGGLAFLAAIFTLKQMARASYEQAPYKVVEQLGEIEVRRYQPFMVATVENTGGFKDTMNTGFRRLAGFIFGRNDRSEKIAMTTPVFFDAPDENQVSKMSFVVPSGYEMKDLPSPDDDGIRFEQHPERTLIALRFSGYITEDLWRKKKERLLYLVEQTDYEALSDVFFCGYDPPAVPGRLRRNEVIVEVREKQ